MAYFQIYYIVAFLIGFLLNFSKCCTSDSKKLHVCLNIYLERDYPLVDAILKAQRKSTESRGRGLVLMEGPDLNSICEKIDSLQSCFAEVAEECVTYWHIYRFDRMMRSLLALYNLLCANSREGLKALLTYATCIQNVKKYAVECEDDSFVWDTIWKQMLRLQIDDEICGPLDQQRQCMIKSLQRNKCGNQASYVYNLTLSTWLQSWCSASPKMNSSSLLVVMLFIYQIFLYIIMI